jgi:hypothetical protein
MPLFICEGTEEQGFKYSRDFGFISEISSFVGNLATANTYTKSHFSKADKR